MSALQDFGKLAQWPATPAQAFRSPVEVALLQLDAVKPKK
jgi:hypothetical protein